MCRKDALNDVARFLKVHGVRCFGAYRAVLVAERGGEGDRWHVHVLTPDLGWLPYFKIIQRWSKFMERRGWHSKTGIHRWHAGDDQGRWKKGFTTPKRAARYAAKYITKDLAAEDYGEKVHRYRDVGTDSPEIVEVEYESRAVAIPQIRQVKLNPIERPDPITGEAILIGYWYEWEPKREAGQHGK